MSPKKYPALSERALSSGAGPGPMNETKPIALNCCSFEGKKRREGKKIKKKGKIKKENKRAGLKVKHSVFCCCFEVLYHKSNVSCLPLPQHISGDTFSAEPFKRKVFFVLFLMKLGTRVIFSFSKQTWTQEGWIPRSVVQSWGFVSDIWKE